MIRNSSVKHCKLLKKENEIWKCIVTMPLKDNGISINGSFKSKNINKLRKIKHIYLENFHAIYNLKLPPSLLSWNLLTCVVIQATIICRFHCFTRVKRLGTLKNNNNNMIFIRKGLGIYRIYLSLITLLKYILGVKTIKIS